MKNLYSLREKLAIVFYDSFTADMTLTQKSEGMNNVLKTASESYIRRMYSEFEVEFKDQFLFSGTVVKIEGSISTYMVMHM
jgi:hypothetical protein